MHVIKAAECLPTAEAELSVKQRPTARPLETLLCD